MDHRVDTPERDGDALDGEQIRGEAAVSAGPGEPDHVRTVRAERIDRRAAQLAGCARYEDRGDVVSTLSLEPISGPRAMTEKDRGL